MDRKIVHKQLIGKGTEDSTRNYLGEIISDIIDKPK